MKRTQRFGEYRENKSEVASDFQLFTMSKFEVLVTLLASAAAFTLIAYWTIVLVVDGNEASFITHPLIRGYCSPPFQLFGLSCREWVVDAVATTEWHVALLSAAAPFLVLAAIWRRALLAVLIGLISLAVLLPSKLSIWPVFLVALLVALSGRRMRNLRKSEIS